MKKFTILLLSLFVIGLVQGQTHKKPVIPPGKSNQSMTRPWNRSIDESQQVPEKKQDIAVKSKCLASESNIGTTRYDLQTNQSIQNRFYRFEDGSIGAVWTMGIADPAFPDRGTGYNFYDGGSWGVIPTSRIETQKTGWPSYVPYGNNGEAIISHVFNVGGLLLNKRDNKGTGNWVQTTISGPAGQPLAWPRLVTNGSDNKTLHLIATTKSVANSGTIYQGVDGAILYSRSLDGGTTWDIQNVILPGLGADDNYGFGGDCYAFAQPKGNTLAFVVGDNWTDLFLMKSTDNGVNWTKTMIYKHPFPKFSEKHTVVIDTIPVSDGSTCCVLDNNGQAHVFFGLQRVNNPDTTDDETSYWPYTDGLAYWNESMPELTTLKYDSLYGTPNLVGWLQDLNGNDTVMEFTGLGTYYTSLTSMPQAVIDDQNRIFLFFTSVMEGMDNGTKNYRHIWGRAFVDGIWKDFVDINSSVIHNFDECVYPTISPNSDLNCHLIYQRDDTPGIAEKGPDPLDPYGDNDIVYCKVPKSDLLIGIPSQPEVLAEVSNCYPNPANDFSYFTLGLTRTSSIKIVISDAFGRKVSEMPATIYQAGQHQVKLDVSSLKPGVYLYSVRSGGSSVTRKMIVL